MPIARSAIECLPDEDTVRSNGLLRMNLRCFQQLHFVDRSDEFAAGQKFFQCGAFIELLVAEKTFPEIGGNCAK